MAMIMEGGSAMAKLASVSDGLGGSGAGSGEGAGADAFGLAFALAFLGACGAAPHDAPKR